MLQLPQCFMCKHFDEEKAKKKEHIYSCKAFPDVIPSEIIEFEPHTNPAYFGEVPMKHKFEHNKIHPKQTGKYLFEDKNA